MWEFYEGKTKGVDDVTKTNLLIQKMDYITMFENKMDELHALTPTDPKRRRKHYWLSLIDAYVSLHNVKTKK